MALLNSRVGRLGAASLVAGTMIGLIGAAFRFFLAGSDRLRDALVDWAHSWPHIGWLAPVVARRARGRISPHSSSSVCAFRRGQRSSTRRGSNDRGDETISSRYRAG